MHLIPYRQFYIVSRLTPSQIAERLQNETIPSPDLFSFKRVVATFEGSVTGAGFNVSYQILGRNSFNPMIIGQLIPYDDGTKIRITMRIHLFILFFFGVVNLLGIILSLASQTYYLTIAWAAFTYLMSTVGFYWQYNEIKSTLLKVFEGETEK